MLTSEPGKHFSSTVPNTLVYVSAYIRKRKKYMKIKNRKTKAEKNANNNEINRSQ